MTTLMYCRTNIVRLCPKIATEGPVSLDRGVNDRSMIDDRRVFYSRRNVHGQGAAVVVADESQLGRIVKLPVDLPLFNAVVDVVTIEYQVLIAIYSNLIFSYTLLLSINKTYA